MPAEACGCCTGVVCETRVACAWRRDGHLVEEKALFAVFGGVMWLHLSGGARGFRGCVGELARLLLSLVL